MSQPILHGFFRSTASWRVRLALHLKGIAFETRAHDLRTGAQRDPAFVALNPQGLVPALEIDGLILTQSLAICGYLDETRPDPPLLPGDAAHRARIRAFAQVIACDTHPVQNLKILQRVMAMTGRKDDGPAWARATIEEGLAACVALLPDAPTRFAFGDAPSLADILLVPQLANARRFGVDLAAFPALTRIESDAATHPAFIAAAPEAQPDFS